MVCRTKRLTSRTHHRESQTAPSVKLSNRCATEKKRSPETLPSWPHGPQSAAGVPICVDFACGSEKSSSTTGRTTMGTFQPNPWLYENERNKSFGIGHGGPKNRAGRSPSSTAEDQVRPGRRLFCSEYRLRYRPCSKSCAPVTDLCGT